MFRGGFAGLSGLVLGAVAAPTFSALAASALRAANVAPDSTVVDIIIPEGADEEVF